MQTMYKLDEMENEQLVMLLKRNGCLDCIAEWLVSEFRNCDKCRAELERYL